MAFSTSPRDLAVGSYRLANTNGTDENALALAAGAVIAHRTLEKQAIDTLGTSLWENVVEPVVRAAIDPAPTVSAIVPGFAALVGGTEVVITGTHFTAGSTVTFDGGDPVSMTIDSETQITAEVDVAGLGTAHDDPVSVVVTNYDGSVTKTNLLKWADAPVVTSLDRDEGPETGGTAVTITGEKFIAGATVTFDGVAATSVVVASGTSITCVTPAGTAGAIDVVVATIGGEDTLAGGFTYVAAPVITDKGVGESGYISGEAATAGGDKSFTIKGTGFVEPLTVLLNGYTPTSVTVVDPETLTVVAPDAIAGTPVHGDPVEVSVSNIGGEDTNDTIFKIAMAPTLTLMDPATGATNVGTPVTITGTNFVDGFTVVVADPTDANVPCGPVAFVSDTEITAVVSEEVPWTDGAEVIAIRIATPGADVTFPAAFEYTNP